MITDHNIIAGNNMKDQSVTQTRPVIGYLFSLEGKFHFMRTVFIEISTFIEKNQWISKH